MKKLLKNKLFMTIFASDMLSNFGDVMYYLALMAYVLELPDAKLGITIVSISETLPILTGFVMGYFADRTPDKVKTIIHTLLFRVVLYSLVGIVVGFQASIWIVLVAAIINVLSDLAGQYENGLHTPLSLRIVADEDRSDSFAFRQAFGSVLYLGFQSAGALLVTFLTYRQLAFINAGTFAASALIIFAVKPKLNQLLKERPIQVETKQEGALLSNMWSSMKEAVKICMGHDMVRRCMIIVPMLNAVLNVISILVAVIMVQDKNFVIINPVTTLALLTVCQLLGGFIGSILVMNVLKDIPIMKTLRLASVLAIAIFVSIYFHAIYGSFLSLLMAGILAGALNPKMSAIIMNEMPEEKMALINGGIATYFQLGSMVFRLLVSGLILFVPVDGISLVLLVITVLLAVYAYASKDKQVPSTV